MVPLIKPFVCLLSSGFCCSIPVNWQANLLTSMAKLFGHFVADSAKNWWKQIGIQNDTAKESDNLNLLVCGPRYFRIFTPLRYIDVMISWHAPDLILSDQYEIYRI